MDKVIDFGKWLARNFFFVSTGIFIIIYLRWFQLTPLELDGSYNDPNEAYILGLILLGIYFLSTTLVWIIKSHYILKNLISIVAFLLFGINVIHIFFFLPRLTTATKCNGKSYFISNNSGTLGYFKPYDQLTIWQNDLGFKSLFFGYGGKSYKIVCDEAQNETNIILPYLEALDYTDGKNPRNYIRPAAQYKNQRYQFSSECNNFNNEQGYYKCDSYTYTLYKCDLDYKSCNSLPVQYTSTRDSELLIIEGNEAANEINIYNGWDDNPARILILTYSEHPSCYVDGCEILEESK